MTSHRKFKILSIDGGGIKGIIPLQFIRHIEQITGTDIHNSFDLIAGTSTGGILSSALVFQDKNNLIANRRKYTIDQLEEIYRNKGKEIFPSPANLVAKTVGHLQKWFSPQFNPKNLNNVLVDYFGNERITSCLKPIFVTSYDIHRNIPITFTLREASLFHNKNPSLVEICRATSAAPTYFPTFSLDYSSERITCIDGGVHMNNPSLGALVEILGNPDFKLYQIEDKSPVIDEICILSLGTGYTNNLIDSNQSKEWGRLQWIKPVIDLSINGPNKTVDLQLKTIFKSFNLPNNYLRLDIAIDKEHSEMSDASDNNINYLISKTNREITTNETLILKIRNFLEIANIPLAN